MQILNVNLFMLTIYVRSNALNQINNGFPSIVIIVIVIHRVIFIRCRRHRMRLSNGIINNFFSLNSYLTHRIHLNMSENRTKMKRTLTKRYLNFDT